MRPSAIVLACLLSGLPAAAQTPAAPPSPARTDPAREREAKALEAKLIAPCCWSQQVSVHQSPAADEIRQGIRVALAAGKSSDEILRGYVAQYGERILAEPPATGFKASLYVLPVALFVASGLGLLWVVRRMARAPAAAAPRTPDAPAAAGTDAAYDERLTDELRDLD